MESELLTTTSQEDSAVPNVTVSSRTLTWRRGSCVLTFLCIGCFLQGATYCHVTSFFDRYSRTVKSLSSVQYGIIMGSYCLVMVLLQPLTAKLVTRKKFVDKTLLFSGWAVDATFCLIMSFAFTLRRGLPFFVGSLIIRILEASGGAVGFIMLYVVTGLELGEISHIVIPLLETVYGLSVVAGPALSGFLFDLYGFPLPFWVLGSTLMFVMILATCLFPKPRESGPDETPSEAVKISTAWRFPVIVNGLCTMNAFMVLSSNEATLAFQLNVKFGMGASESGVLFLYAGGFYASSSLLFGFLSKRISDPRYFVLVGQIITLVALALQGPLIPIGQSKEVIILAQILLGAGFGPALVCSYMQSLKYISKGKESKEMYAVISSVFNPASSCGCSMGPLIAGVVRHYFSYEAVIAVNAAQTAFMSVLLLATLCMSDVVQETEQSIPLDNRKKFKSPESDGGTELLP